MRLNRRTLALAREVLTELAPADLAAVAGGGVPTWRVQDCVAAGTTLQPTCLPHSDEHSCIDCLTRGC